MVRAARRAAPTLAGWDGVIERASAGADAAFALEAPLRLSVERSDEARRELILAFLPLRRQA